MGTETERATIDEVVSAHAWAGFPELRGSVERWADLAGPEGGDLLVSACAIGAEWVSVRVTLAPGGGWEPDWIEWLAPRAFDRASPAALDHFVQREMAGAARKLAARRGTGLRPMLADPGARELDPPTNPNGGDAVAKSKPQAPEPAKKTKEVGRGVPAPTPAPAPAAARSGPKSKSATNPKPTAKGTKKRS